MSRLTLPLRRLFKIVNGGTPTAAEENWGGSVPWATPVDLAKGVVGLSETQRTLTMLGASSGSSMVPEGSILLSTRAPIGYTAITEVPMAFNQGCRALVALGPGDARFFRYQPEARGDELQAAGVGATFVELSSGALAGFEVDCPDVAEQRRVSDFLDAEVARIEKISSGYLRMQSLLSERVQSLVDGLMDSDGDVPLRYAVRFREGPGIMAEDFRDEGVPLIRISGLRQGAVTLQGCNYLDEEKVLSKWGQFRLKLGDYIISGSASIGNVSVVLDDSVQGAVPYTGLIVLRPATAGVSMKYVAAVLASSRFARQIDVLKTGSTMQHFGPTHLSQVRIPLPLLGKQNLIASEVEAVQRQKVRSEELVGRQVALLRERKRALITAAVTGQIDVTTARGADVS